MIKNFNLNKNLMIFLKIKLTYRIKYFKIILKTFNKNYYNKNIIQRIIVKKSLAKINNFIFKKISLNI